MTGTTHNHHNHPHPHMQQGSVTMPHILKIFQDDAPELKVKCEPVKNIDDGILKIVNNMAYTMLKNSRAAALAANQVGYTKQVITMRYGDDVLVLINPSVVKKSKRVLNSLEGCLSIKHTTQQYTVKRNSSLTVRFLDIKGREKTKTFKRRQALVIQHEIDHLNGVLISDTGIAKEF